MFLVAEMQKCEDPDKAPGGKNHGEMWRRLARSVFGHYTTSTRAALATEATEHNEHFVARSVVFGTAHRWRYLDPVPYLAPAHENAPHLR